MALTKVEAEQLQPAQTSITSVGTLTGLTVSGDLTVDTSTLKVDSSNNRVGIGITSPDEILHIKGDGARVYVDSDDYNLVSLGRRASSGADLDRAYLRMKSAGTNTVVIDTAGISYFNGGTLAVGTTSTVGSSAEKFVVLGTGSAHSRFAGNSDTYSTVYIKNSSTTANTNQPFLTFQDTGGNRGNFGLRYSTAQLVIQGHGGVGIKGGSGFSGDPSIFVNTSGNVGINTDSPNQIFHIKNTGQHTTMRIENDNADFLIQAGDAGDDGLHFYDLTNTAYRMTIDNAGQVGIGTTQPENLLHIKKGNSGTTYTADSADQLILENSGSVVMDIRTPTGNTGGILFSDADARGRGIIQYAHSNDTMYFNTGGAAAMNIDSSGRVIKSLQPSFQVRYPGTTALNAGGSGTILVYNSVFHNVGSHYNTSNGRFTAPVTGIYIFHAQIRVDGFGGNYSYLTLEHFSSTGVQQSNKGRDLQDGNNSSYLNHVIAQNVYLLAGEYVHLRYQNNGDSSVNIDSDSYFSGYLLG